MGHSAVAMLAWVPGGRSAAATRVAQSALNCSPGFDSLPQPCTTPPPPPPQGAWVDGAMHGQGAFIDAAGRRWAGQFFNGSGPGLTFQLN